MGLVLLKYNIIIGIILITDFVSNRFVADAELLSLDGIRANLEIQLSELESLQSMFCNPSEIQVEDLCILNDIKEFVCSKNNILPKYLDFTVNIQIDDKKFELCVTLSHKYPLVEPELFVRNQNLNRSQHTSLNKELSQYMSQLEKGEPCIFSAISWLQDNAQTYVKTKGDVQQIIKQIKENETLMRYWIYSHHIYNKIKRREIVDLANQLQLTGFCMPGKLLFFCEAYQHSGAYPVCYFYARL